MVVVIVLAFLIVFVSVGLVLSSSALKTRVKKFRSLIVQDNFREIEPGSYVMKNNRFGDIIRQDFLGLPVVDVKAGKGVIRYNADESIILCDWSITEKNPTAKKDKVFSCLALLHLRKNTVPFSVKVSLGKNNKKMPGFLAHLQSVINNEDGFSVSCDGDDKLLGSLGFWDELVKQLKEKFPLNNCPYGLIAAGPKGWLILVPNIANSGVFNSIVELDKKITDVFLKKTV